MDENGVVERQLAEMEEECGLGEGFSPDTIQQMLEILPHGFRETIIEQLYWFLGDEEARKVSMEEDEDGVRLDAILDHIMELHPGLETRKAAFEHAIDVIHHRFHPYRINITLDSPVPAGKKEKKKK